HWRPGDGSTASHMVRMGMSSSAAFAGAGGATIYPETFTLGDRFSSPSGGSSADTASSDSQSNATYTEDTFYRDFSIVWGLTKNTSTGNIANIVVHSGSGNRGGASVSSLMRFQFS